MANRDAALWSDSRFISSREGICGGIDCRSFCLLNLGRIRWKTRSTAVGAIAASDKVPKYNPDYETRDTVEDLITDAKVTNGKEIPVSGRRHS